MPDPVALTTVHHEGAGAPSDDPRGAEGGYTYWIGATRWTHLRNVWDSFATLNLNGESLDLCLSGTRMEYPVTDQDLSIIAGACADARARGYVVDAPSVRAHRDSPGSSTVCPGDLTMAVWPQVVAACTAGASAAPTKGGAVNLARTKTGDGYWIADSTGAVITKGDALYFGGANDQQLAAPIVGIAARPQGDGYWLVGADGGVFAFGGARFHEGAAGDPKEAAAFVAIEAAEDGDGYWLLGADGGVFAYGSAPFKGSAVGEVH
jgi:hypothetical protein